MLKTERVHGAWSLEEIFGEGQWCPFCHGEEFTHVEGLGITCDGCEAEFGVRMTAGDPGVVVDAYSGESNRTIRHRGFAIENVAFSKGSTACWQVLKECEEGLDDRDHWLTYLNQEAWGWHIYHTRNMEPLGKAVYFFAVYDVARVLAWERWGERTKAGKEAARLRSEGVYQYEWPAWICDHRRGYLREWEAKYRDQLDGYGLDEGYYFAEQCGRTWDDDCFHVHRCIPRPGETPVRTRSEGLGWPDASEQAREVEGLRRAVGELEGKVESWKTAWGNQRDEIGRLTARIAELQDAGEKAAKDLSDAVTREVELVRECDLAGERVRALKGEALGLRATIRTRDATIADLECVVGELQRSLEGARETIGELTDGSSDPPRKGQHGPVPQCVECGGQADVELECGHNVCERCWKMYGPLCSGCDGQNMASVCMFSK